MMREGGDKHGKWQIFQFIPLSGSESQVKILFMKEHSDLHQPGDLQQREQVAQFMLANESALRRQIGREVAQSPGVDVDDVFSTMLRRVDYAACKGSFQMRSQPEAWGFLTQVVQRAVQRHRMRAARFAATVARIAEVSRPAVKPLEIDERAELVSIMNAVAKSRPQDAELIQHRLRGKKWREISAAMGISEQALRQRWSALTARLREQHQGEDYGRKAG